MFVLKIDSARPWAAKSVPTGRITVAVTCGAGKEKDGGKGRGG